MLQPPAASRRRLAQILSAAYGDGLLSEHTLTYRLDLLLTSRVIDPARVVGDLTVRSPRRAWSSAVARALALARRFAYTDGTAELRPPTMLALDWTGAAEVLVIGRHPSCDIVLNDPAVSRRHARLRFRDGTWSVQDMGSTNGTRLNNVAVGRCRLRPGDHLVLGDEHLIVD